MPEFALRSDRLTDNEIWWGTRYRLRERLHRWTECPQRLVMSARGVVFRGSRVMVVSSSDGRGGVMNHVIPGGRVEKGESLLATVKREVGEETGWHIARPRPLAVLHYRHLLPRPEGYAYAYPDFLQPIFLVDGTRYDRRLLKREGEAEIASRMLPVSRALEILPPVQQILLREALAMR
ncbi:MAG TPA: NUDIX domain-containing protein [Rhizomicrobium sp.]|nr:NUDIX domain-containing protein [Rhizomicrobium sp.]